MERKYAKQNELYHFGILGQIKGRRRFQYYDGSLTPEGRERYGVGPARTDAKTKAVGSKPEGGSGTKKPTSPARAAALEKARETRRRNQEEKKRQAEEQRKQEEEKAALKAKYSKDPIEMSKHMDLFTTDELKAAKARFDAEAELSRAAEAKSRSARNDLTINDLAPDEDSKQYINSPTKVFANREKFTKEQIDALVSRYTSEEKLYANAEAERKRMQDMMKKGQDTLQTLTAWSQTLRGVYSEYKNVKKLFSDEVDEKNKKAEAEKAKKNAEEKEKYSGDLNKMSKHANLFTNEEISNAMKRQDLLAQLKDYPNKQKAEREQAAAKEQAQKEQAERNQLKERYADNPKLLFEHKNLFSYNELQEALNKFTIAEKIKYYAEGNKKEQKKKEE